MKWACDRLTGFWRVAVCDAFLFFSFIGTVNVWRGVWELLDIHFMPGKQAINIKSNRNQPNVEFLFKYFLQMIHWRAIWSRTLEDSLYWPCWIVQIRYLCAVYSSMPKSQPVNVLSFPCIMFGCSSKKSAQRSDNVCSNQHLKKAT